MDPQSDRKVVGTGWEKTRAEGGSRCQGAAMLAMYAEAVKEGVNGGNLYVLRVEATGVADRSI